MPIIKIHNSITGENIEREMTPDETKIYEKQIAMANETQAKLTRQFEARQSALQKLLALGLTEEEIAAL